MLHYCIDEFWHFFTTGLQNCTSSTLWGGLGLVGIGLATVDADPGLVEAVSGQIHILFALSCWTKPSSTYPVGVTTDLYMCMSFSPGS